MSVLHSPTSVEGFNPIEDRHARILILGSMPGRASIVQQQYYAHPRNAFWSIMASLYNFEVSLSYTDRCQQLLMHQVALWDVLQQCRREARDQRERHSSLDANIRPDSQVLNNFEYFFREHPEIHSVYCNGQKAYDLFCKKVMVKLIGRHDNKELRVFKLPSTSPAYASMSFSEKLQVWSRLRAGF